MFPEQDERDHSEEVAADVQPNALGPDWRENRSALRWTTSNSFFVYFCPHFNNTNDKNMFVLP